MKKIMRRKKLDNKQPLQNSNVKKVSMFTIMKRGTQKRLGKGGATMILATTAAIVTTLCLGLNTVGIIPNPRINNTVEDGEVAIVNYVGRVNGVAFNGGTANRTAIDTAQNTFIAGFKEGVIGMRVGEVRNWPVTFPANYNVASLAGANAVFTFTLLAVY